MIIGTQYNVGDSAKLKHSGNEVEIVDIEVKVRRGSVSISYGATDREVWQGRVWESDLMPR
jgi:hypothetical protein